MTITINRRFLSVFPLAVCCAVSIPTSYAETPVITTVLDEAPPPWSGSSSQAGANPAANTGGIAGWYQQRLSRNTVSQPQLQSLQMQADAGDTEAMYQLGLLYQSGRGVSADAHKARQLFDRAARAGNAYAQYALALQLRQQNKPSLIQQSVNWQQKAAQQGYAEAQYGLGLLYANGQYVAQDLHKARHWLNQAVQRNHIMAGIALQDLGNFAAVRSRQVVQPAQQPRPQPVVRPRSARPIAPKSADTAYTVATTPSAQRPQQVAALTPVPEIKRPPQQTRTVVEQQPSQASPGQYNTEAIRHAAEKGDMYAQLMYGALFEDGEGGVQQDPAQAVRWYLKAARQGYAKAQHNLALLYEDGKGVPQDYEQAAIWYQKAAESGFSEAQNNLAVLYILGNGVPVDRNQAEKLLRQAAAQGNANAKRNLQMLLNGEG
ncbi:MAG: hypothetical protein CSA79_05705 [Thiothrix nivea]|nr:MAG: hypothetical protein CSA79_05705 [Thiothrix nivea]